MALKAINKTRYILYADVAAIVINLAALVALVPTWGLVGVTTAYVISTGLQSVYLGWCTTQFYEMPVRVFIPWVELSKVVLAVALPLALTYGSYMTDHFKLFGVIMGSMLYLSAYALLLRLFHVREAHTLFERVRGRLVTYIPIFPT